MNLLEHIPLALRRAERGEPIRPRRFPLWALALVISAAIAAPILFPIAL